MINIINQYKIERDRLVSSASKERASDEIGGTGFHDRLIEIAQLGDLTTYFHRDSFTDGPIQFNIANQGNAPEDWAELGLNHVNPGETFEGVDYPSNDRSYYIFELDDDLIDALDGKTIRFVAYYSGSFDCEASRIDEEIDYYDKSTGSNSKGDVQITSILHESVGTSGVAGRGQIAWSQCTTSSTVDSRGSKETPLESYKNQTWSSINTLTSGSGSWVSGQFNRVRSSRLSSSSLPQSPTSGTGALPKPSKYSEYATAYVNTDYGVEMWARTSPYYFSNYTAIPSATAWDRIIVSLGAHGDACGTIKVYIYVEPIGNSLPTPSDTVAPTGPDLVSANIESDEATLTWEPVSASDLDTYQIYYRYKGVSETSFSSYEYLGFADQEGCRATYDLNNLLSIPERYGEFQFKVLPQDDSANIGTGAEFPVKGQFEDISFVTSGTKIVNSGGQTLSITGIQANDLIMLSGTSDSQQVDSPTGFTELEDDDGTANPGAVVCYKIASGTSENITLTNQGGNNANQIIWTYQVFRNVSTSNPIDTSVSNHNSGSSRINLPSVTTTTDNCMIVVYGMIDDDGYPESSLFLPSGYTKQVFGSTGFGFNLNYSTVIGGYKLEGNAGSYNPGFIQLAQNDGRDGFTIALRPKQEDFTTTLPEFTYIYWEATVSTNTSFYVYCEFDVTNSDIPTSVFAYATTDGTTPTTSNYDSFAELTDTTTGSTAATWDSTTQLGFSASGVSVNDDVKVLLVAVNSKGDENSVVVTLTIGTLGNNNTEYVYP